MALDNQIFLVENLVKLATITASSENAQYPLSNLKDDRRTKTFRSTSNSTTVTLDFGTPVDINTIALVDSTLESFGFSALTLELNNVDVWTSPSVSQAVTIDTGNSFAYHYFDTVQTYRYARLVLTGSEGFVELGKVFLGKSVELGELSFSYPLQVSWSTNANVSRNRLGQKFIDEINTQREISGGINTLTKEEFQPLLDMLKYASYTRPIWIIFPDEAPITEDNDQLNGYYYLKGDAGTSFVAGNYWNVNLAFEEGL
jgi:hypothetical protein